MLYLVNIDRSGKFKDTYKLFETHTESISNVNSAYVKELINEHRMEIKNIYTDIDGMHIKDWPYHKRIKDKKSICILLGKINENKFKIIASTGEITYIDAYDLKLNIENSNIANCDFEEYTFYKSIDTCSIITNKEFEDSIELEHTKFRSKVLLLGMNIDYEYRIEGKEVKIINYTGSSKRVIIPNFVTTICKEAFAHKHISEIQLNKGLKYIGKNAFEDNRLEHIIIPETVQFIYMYALVNNTGYLYDKDGLSFNTEKVKLLNKRTKII